MCGRYTGFTEDEENEIMQIIKDVDKKVNSASVPLAVKQSGEIFPTDTVPVLVGDGADLAARAMKWGYPGYPDRSKPQAKPKPLINAKSETVTSLPTWKDSIMMRRCIVPSNGFYEWQHSGSDRTKYLFRVPGEISLYMAAIYKQFPLADGGEMPHFSIMTTAANASMVDVHSRMPLVLRRDEFEEWLRGDWERLLEQRNIDLDRIES